MEGKGIVLTFFILFLLTGSVSTIYQSSALINSPSAIKIQSIYEENFDSNVFLESSWTRSDSSVYVDTDMNYLIIDSSNNYDDYAILTDISILNTSFTIEYRSKLVSSGRNYMLPWFILGYSNGSTLQTNYVVDSSGHGWFFIDWTYKEQNGPTSENLWWDVKIELTPTTATLNAKESTESNYHVIISQKFNGDLSFDYIKIIQPWDSVNYVDWIKSDSLQPNSGSETTSTSTTPSSTSSNHESTTSTSTTSSTTSSNQRSTPTTENEDQNSSIGTKPKIFSLVDLPFPTFMTGLSLICVILLTRKHRRY